MRTLQRTVQQTQRSVADRSQSLESAWRDLGESAIRSQILSPDELPDRIAASLQNVAAAREKQQQNSDTARELQGLRQGLGEVKASSSELPKAIEALERENIPIYRRAGETALSLYGHRELPDERLTGVFAEPRAAASRLADVDRDIDQITARQKRSPASFLRSKLQLASRRVKRGSLQRQLDSAVEDLGKSLLQDDTIQLLPDPDLEAAATGYYHNDTRLQELTDQLTELQQQEEQMRERIAELCGETPVRKHLDTLELQNHTLQTDIHTELVRIGKHVYAQATEGDRSSPQGVAELITRIQELTDGIQSDRQRIQRLEAAIEIRRLESQRRDVERRIQGIQRQMETLQQESERLNGEAHTAAARIEELQRLHGPLDELLK